MTDACQPLRWRCLAAAAAFLAPAAAGAADITVNTSSSLYPDVNGIVGAFSTGNPGSPVIHVQSNGSGAAMRFLCSGGAGGQQNVAVLSRPVSASEIALCQANGIATTAHSRSD